MNERIELLKKKMKAFKIEASLLTNPISIMYYTYSTFKSGTMLITQTGSYLFVNYNELIYTQENINCDIDIIEARDYPGIIRNIIGDMYLCCEMHDISEYEFNFLCRNVNVREDYAIDFLIENQRSIKDEKEIEYITRAQTITEDSIYEVANCISPGMTEKEISHLLKTTMINKGSDGESFDTVVSSGSNTRCPHWYPTDRQIQKGDLIMIDTGATINGYHSDMTRMLCIGEPSDEAKSLYTHVYNLFNIILENTKDSVSIDSIFNSYSQYIDMNIKNQSYNTYFNAGHGVGLDIHETPSLSPTYSKFYSLERNMALAIEPAIYTDTFGIRIENMIVVTDDSYKMINKSKYDNIIVI